MCTIDLDKIVLLALEQLEPHFSMGDHLFSSNEDILFFSYFAGGDYVIEINGNLLSVLGQGALRFIDRPWNPGKARQVTSVQFSSLDYNYVASVMSKMKTRFPHAEYFNFIDTNISCLGQINSLADLQGLTALTIDAVGNPIHGKPWRSYAIYRLSHWGLKHINGTQVVKFNYNKVGPRKVE